MREASDDVPASSVTANGAPRGEQHITMTSMEIESTDNVPGSSVTANGEPRGDPHITMSSPLVLEAIRIKWLLTKVSVVNKVTRKVYSAYDHIQYGSYTVQVYVQSLS